MSNLRIIFETPLPVWLVLTLGALLMATAVWFAVRDGRLLKRGLRIFILTLRVVAIILLVIIVLSPKIVTKRPDTQKPGCIVLVDGSESMTFEDEYSGDAAKAVEALFNPSNPGGEEKINEQGKPSHTREAILRRTLKKTQLLARLSKDFDVTGAIFADTIRAVSLEDKLPESIIGEDSFSTNLGGAIDKVVSGWGKTTQTAAVIVISDGSWNRGSDPVAPARSLGSRAIPIYAVALGDPNPARDIAVTAVRPPKQAFLGQQISLDVDIRGVGFGARSVPLEVVLDGDIIAKKDVFLAPSGQIVTTSITLIPDKPGFYTYSVRIPVQPGETHDDNNVGHASVDVSEKKIGVLIIESVPRWEFRFLKNVMERDPTVEVKVFLARPGVGPAKGGEYVDTLPRDRKEMAKFDLVILGDISDKFLPPAFLEELASMVVKRGTGLIVMAGRRGNYLSLRNSPIEKILPVRLPERTAVGGTPTGASKFRMELTADGRRSLMLRLEGDSRRSEAIWSGLPRLVWCADVEGLQRGANALAIHPFWTVGAEKLPLIAHGRVGAGKVLFMGVEETWRWREAVGDHHHYRFWAQAVRWMTQRRFQQDDAAVRLSAEPAQSRIGSTIAVEAYCLDRDGFPLGSATVQLLITDAEGGTQQIQMNSIEGGWGLYEAAFKPTSAGKYQLQAIVDDYGPEPTGSPVEVEVRQPDVEKNFPSANRTAMAAISDASGGRMFEFWEADELPELLSAQTKQRILTREFSLGENLAAFLIPLALLGTEWIVRKRSALA